MARTGFQDYDFTSIWQVIGILIVTVVVSILAVAIFADHGVDYYYIEGMGPQGAGITCAKAHKPWIPGDQPAFCSDDSQKVVDFVQRANAAATRKAR